MTDTSKATPRPWRLGASGKVYAGDTHSPILIATVHAQGPDMEWIPNAEALVAAVNAYDAMREALELARTYIHNRGDCRREVDGQYWHAQACIDITAALAAAEGKGEPSA